MNYYIAPITKERLAKIDKTWYVQTDNKDCKACVFYDCCENVSLPCKDGNWRRIDENNKKDM